MKKIAVALIFAALLISGCSSAENAGVSLPSSEPAPEGAAEQLSVAELSEKFVPPSLKLELGAAGGTVELTAGSYTWEENGVSSSSSADPISVADASPDVAVVDISALTGNPKLIADGGRIASAVCRRDSSDSRPCEIDGGELVLCGDGDYDVYSVTVDYDNGSCEYIFKTVCAGPPTLRIRVGNAYRALSRSNYEWSAQCGDEICDTLACGAAAWECRGSCPVIDLSGEAKGVVMLPDGAEITGVCAYSDESVCETPAFGGRTFELPADPLNRVYSIFVDFPQGSCEYVFSTFINGIPQDAEGATEEPYSRTDGEPLTEPPAGNETAPDQAAAPEQPVPPDLPEQPALTAPPAQPTEPAQPTTPTEPALPDYPAYNWGGHHGNSHHGHHGGYGGDDCRLSGCRLGELGFYGYGTDISAEENYKMDYEGAITDENVVAELWEIISRQELQPEVTGDNSYTGTPYVVITDGATGKKYTVSFTDMVTYGNCPYGCPDVEGHVCAKPNVYTPCMRISDGVCTHHAVVAGDAARFNELVMSSLKQYEPVRDAVFRKSAKTDWIVFVQRHTNYAWEHTDQGYFIDCYGNKYVFDFGGEMLGEGEEFFDALWRVYCDTDPIERGLYDENSLFDILIDDIYAIDRNAEMSESSSGGADMGQTSLYVADLDGKLIKLRSEGDWNRYLEDDAAKRLCGFFDKGTF